MSSRIKSILACSAATLMVAGNSTTSAQTMAALAGGPPAPAPRAAPLDRETIVIPKGKAANIDFPFNIGTARTTNPAIADLSMMTSTHAVISGVNYGETDIQFYDTAGRLLMTRNIRIEQDHTDLDRMIAAVAPDARVTVQPLNDRLVLTGTVPSNSDSAKIVQLASGYTGAPEKVLNYLVSTGNDQVLLKVEVVEVSRSSIKQLGFNTNAIFGQLGTDQWAIGNTPTYAVNGGFQGGFSGGYARNTTSQPVGNSPASLFANLVGIPYGATGISPTTIGQFVNGFLTGSSTLSGAQSSWVSAYLNQYASQVQVVDAASNATYTMADVGVSAANLPAQYQAYLNGTSALGAHGNEWMRKFADSLPDYNNAYYNFSANPTSTFIDRSNPANPVATGRVGSAGLNQARDLMQAFERAGLIRTLAEPSATVISGESSDFKAGGQFPAPTGRDKDGNVTFEYKDYGVAMAFTPVVLSSGRISLKINAQVSDLTSVGAQTIASFGGSTTLPGLTIRHASTTVELPAGGSIVLAGLLQDSTRENIDKVPGISDVPILGALSRSRDYQSGQTELAIIATVELVHPVGRNRLQTPADGLRIASDMSTLLMGKLNTAYQAPPAAVEGRTYEGPFGNVID